MGRIEVTGLVPGSHVLALLTVDCRVTWARVELRPGLGREVELRLPPAFGAAAEAAREEEAERVRSKGKVMVASEIDQVGARSATDLVRRLAPSMVRGWTGVVGEPVGVRGRAPSSIIGDGEPVLVVDGARVHDVANTLDQILPAEIDTLEVLPGAAGGWEFGSDGAAGVIRIVRRRGIATGTPEALEVQPCTVPWLRG
jgi:outer membrane receptor protein involved in Fe transport